jgi:ubiquinone biosynthesis protein
MKLLVATDRSDTAQHAVAWAADYAERFDGELVLLQVLPEAWDGAEERLRGDAEGLPRARPLVLVEPDVAGAIVRTAAEEAADVVVLGNAGMSGRKEFLLGNVPNRVSHTARCTVVIVNTADATVAASDPASEGEDALLGRMAEIVRRLVRVGLESRGRSGVSEEAGAERLRVTLEELGPTFAKLGQLLSTRPDIVSAPLAEELAKLQDSVAPLTEAEVVRVMEQELRVPWEDVFASIDADPLAAGTIAQVHLATLESGERVVVKVQRPRARAEITRDVALLELLAEQAVEREALREFVDIPALVGHLSDSLERELDFSQEAANIERMRALVASYSRIDVPHVFEDFSTSRLLVLEYVEGVPIRASADTAERRDAGRQLLEAFYRQVLVDGFFHADPHPGNLLWTGDKIVLLDLGMVGELDPEVRGLLIVLLLAFANGDARFLSETMLMLGGNGYRADVDLDALEHEFAAFIEEFRIKSLQDIQFAPMLNGVIRIGTRHGVRLPASLALSGKAFGQIQLAMAELDPLLDPFDVVGDFLARNVRSRLLEHANPQHLYYEAEKLKLRVGRFVEALERAAGARPGQNLQVDFVGFAEIERSIGRASRRLSLAAAAAATIVGAAATAAAGTAGWIPAVFGIVGAAAGVWLTRELLSGS